MTIIVVNSAQYEFFLTNMAISPRNLSCLEACGGYMVAVTPFRSLFNSWVELFQKSMNDPNDSDSLTRSEVSLDFLIVVRSHLHLGQVLCA